MAKKIKLSKQEREAESSIARGEWKSVKKEARINIRLSPSDLDLVRQAAAKEGVPYQTFIASTLHKYVTNQFVSREQWTELLERISTNKKAG